MANDFAGRAYRVLLGLGGMLTSGVMRPSAALRKSALGEEAPLLLIIALRPMAMALFSDCEKNEPLPGVGVPAPLCCATAASSSLVLAAGILLSALRCANCSASDGGR